MTEQVGRSSRRVLVWDLDETLIIFHTLTTGRFAHHFHGAKDPRLGIKLGRRWEKLIIEVCDDYFFFEQVENFNEPTLDSWTKYDDQRDLLTYDFNLDGLGETRDDDNNPKLAFRHRRISELYMQGVESLLTREQVQEWQELYALTDSYTDGWLTAGRTILQSCLETSASQRNGAAEANGPRNTGLCSPNTVNVLVTSGSLVPSLVKVLLFKLDKFFSYEHVYSSTEVGKLQCFEWIQQQFGDPNVKFCVIGDGLDECEAAEGLRWPFIQIDTPPYGHLCLPKLTLQVIDRYMRVIYGDDKGDSWYCQDGQLSPPQ